MVNFFKKIGQIFIEITIIAFLQMPKFRRNTDVSININNTLYFL